MNRHHASHVNQPRRSVLARSVPENAPFPEDGALRDEERSLLEEEWKSGHGSSNSTSQRGSMFMRQYTAPTHSRVSWSMVNAPANVAKRSHSFAYSTLESLEEEYSRNTQDKYRTRSLSYDDSLARAEKLLTPEDLEREERRKLQSTRVLELGLFFSGMRPVEVGCCNGHFRWLGYLWPCFVSLLLMLRMARNFAYFGWSNPGVREAPVTVAWQMAVAVALISQWFGFYVTVKRRVINQGATALYTVNKILAGYDRPLLLKALDGYHEYVRSICKQHMKVIFGLLIVPWVMFNGERVLNGRKDDSHLPFPLDDRLRDHMGALYPRLFAFSDIFLFLNPPMIIVLISIVAHLIRRRAKRMKDVLKQQEDRLMQERQWLVRQASAEKARKEEHGDTQPNGSEHADADAKQPDEEQATPDRAHSAPDAESPPLDPSLLSFPPPPPLMAPPPLPEDSETRQSAAASAVSFISVHDDDGGAVDQGAAGGLGLAPWPQQNGHSATPSRTGSSANVSHRNTTASRRTPSSTFGPGAGVRRHTGPAAPGANAKRAYTSNVISPRDMSVLAVRHEESFNGPGGLGHVRDTSTDFRARVARARTQRFPVQRRARAAKQHLAPHRGLEEEWERVGSPYGCGGWCCGRFFFHIERGVTALAEAATAVMDRCAASIQAARDQPPALAANGLSQGLLQDDDEVPALVEERISTAQAWQEVYDEGKIRAGLFKLFMPVVLVNGFLYFIWAVCIAATYIKTSGETPPFKDFVSIVLMPGLQGTLLYAVIAKMNRHTQLLKQGLRFTIDQAEISEVARQSTYDWNKGWHRANITLGQIFKVYSHLLTFALSCVVVMIPLAFGLFYLELPKCLTTCVEHGFERDLVSHCSDAQEASLNFFSSYVSLGGFLFFVYFVLRFTAGHRVTRELAPYFLAASIVFASCSFIIWELTRPAEGTVQRVHWWSYTPAIVGFVSMYVVGARYVHRRIAIPVLIRREKQKEFESYYSFWVVMFMSGLALVVVHFFIVSLVIPEYAIGTSENVKLLITVFYPLVAWSMYVYIGRMTARIPSVDELVALGVAIREDQDPDVEELDRVKTTVEDEDAVVRDLSLSSRGLERSHSALNALSAAGDLRSVEMGLLPKAVADRSVTVGDAPVLHLAKSTPLGTSLKGSRSIPAPRTRQQAIELRRLRKKQLQQAPEDGLVYLGPLSRTAIVLLAKVYFETFGRLFIANLANLDDQITAVVILAVFEIASRGTRPLQFRLLARLAGKSTAEASQMAEAKRVNPYDARETALSMMVQIYTLLFTSIFTYVVGQHFEVKNPPTFFFILKSMCLQLVGAVATDLFALKLEESYLERPILKNWDRYRRHWALMAFPFHILTVCVFVRYFTIIVKFTGDATPPC